MKGSLLKKKEQYVWLKGTCHRGSRVEIIGEVGKYYFQQSSRWDSKSRWRFRAVYLASSFQRKGKAKEARAKILVRELVEDTGEPLTSYHAGLSLVPVSQIKCSWAEHVEKQEILEEIQLKREAIRVQQRLANQRKLVLINKELLAKRITIIGPSQVSIQTEIVSISLDDLIALLEIKL